MDGPPKKTCIPKIISDKSKMKCVLKLKETKVDGLLQKRKKVQEMSFGPKSSSSIAVKANFCLHSSMHSRVEKGYHHYCVYNITTTQWDIGNLSRHFKHLSFCSPRRLWVVQRYKAESLAGARKLDIAKPMSKWPLYTAICSTHTKTGIKNL